MESIKLVFEGIGRGVPPLDAVEQDCKMMGLCNRNIVAPWLVALLLITGPTLAQECSAVSAH